MERLGDPPGSLERALDSESGSLGWPPGPTMPCGHLTDHPQLQFPNGISALLQGSLRTKAPLTVQTCQVQTQARPQGFRLCTNYMTPHR